MHYHQVMRTTLDIDDDVLEAAKELAQAEGKTAGAMLSELARKAILRGLHTNRGFAEGEQPPIGGKWLTLPRRPGPARIVTTALVNRIQEALDLEDAMPQDFTKEDGDR